MYEAKIEKFTDKLLSRTKTTRIDKKNMTMTPSSILHQSEQGSHLQINNQLSTREKFRSQKQQLGLSKTDIDKLQLMCIDLSAEDYLNKLIEIYDQEKIIRGQAEVLPTNEEPNQKLHQTSSCIKSEVQRQVLEQNSDVRNIDGDKLFFSKLSPENRKEIIKESDPTFENDYSPKLVFLNKPSKNNENSRRQSKSRKRNSNIISINSLEFEKIKELQKSKEVEKREERIYAQSKTVYREQQVPKSKQLEEMCYAEIGKKMVIITQKQIRRQFFQTNLHIRAYLMRNIVEYIKYIAEFSPFSIFILPNQRALHFEADQKPKELNPYLEHTKYVQIIRNVNHIIQKNIFKQKYQEEVKDYWPYSMLAILIIIVVMIMVMAFVGDNGEGVSNPTEQYLQVKDVLMIFTGLLICVFLVILIGYSLHCYTAKITFRPVCEIVYQDIDSYFKYINGKMQNNLQWIIGESFFWVEVKIHPHVGSGLKEQHRDRESNILKKKIRRKGFYGLNVEDQINPSLRQ